MDDRTRYPRDCAADLHKRLTEQEGPHQAGDGRVRSADNGSRLPTEDELIEMLDVVFALSLLQEESRNCTASLALVSPEEVKKLQGAALTFEEPYPLAAGKLAKIAPAANPAHSLIAVSPIDGRLQAWGLVDRGERPFILDHVQELPWLIVRADRPGALRVWYSTRLVARFERGAYFPQESKDLSDMVREAGWNASEAFELQRLATRVVAHAHGAAIFAVKEHATPKGLVHLKRWSDGSSFLADRFREDESFLRGEALQRDGETIVHFANRRANAGRAHSRALDIVASLTAVDGAVVIDNRFNLLGFGGVVEASSKELQLWLAPSHAPSSPEVRQFSEIGGN